MRALTFMLLKFLAMCMDLKQKAISCSLPWQNPAICYYRVASGVSGIQPFLGCLSHGHKWETKLTNQIFIPDDADSFDWLA